jgi:hypothetical protein
VRKWIVPSAIALVLAVSASARWSHGRSGAALPRIGRRPAVPKAESTPDVVRPMAEACPPEIPVVLPSVEREAPWPAYRRTLLDLSKERNELGESRYRKAVLEATARFLDFDFATVEAFEATRQVVQAELERVQLEMGKEFAGYPIDLSDQDLRRIQVDVEERYREDRRKALGRMDVFLGDGENHRQFRDHLELWTMELGR